MKSEDYKALLQFSDAWFTLGVISLDELSHYGAAYEANDDKNTEHYRYGAFLQFLKRVTRPIDPVFADALYELGASDPNHSMGASIMTHIVELPECPPSVLEKALHSGWKHLERIVLRKRALSSNP